jgi:hypothetical protein
MSWRSVLLVEEIRIPRENHQPISSHWQTLSHNVVLSTPDMSEIRTHNVSGDGYWLAYVVVIPTNTRSRPRRPLDMKTIWGGVFYVEKMYLKRPLLTCIVLYKLLCNIPTIWTRLLLYISSRFLTHFPNRNLSCPFRTRYPPSFDILWQCKNYLPVLFIDNPLIMKWWNFKLGKLIITITEYTQHKTREKKTRTGHVKSLD